MNRHLAAAGVAATLAAGLAGQPGLAETPLERGTYLVRGIVTCGNCHTTRDAEMRFVEGMELAGGFKIEEEHFTARAYPSEPGLTTCWVCGCHRRNVRLMFRHAQPLEVRPPDVPRRLRGALSR